MARVLIAEDDRVILNLLTHILESAGHHVLTASGGADALDIIRSSNPPQLVITDLEMPGIDGYNVLKTMRRPGSPAADIPVIVLTAHVTRPIIVQSIKLGANDFVSKLDLQIPAILEKIARLTGEEKEEAAPSADAEPEADAADAEAKAQSDSPPDAEGEAKAETDSPPDAAEAKADSAEEQKADAAEDESETAENAEAENAQAAEPEPDKEPIHPLPEVEETAEFFSGLIGKEVAVAEAAKPIKIGPKSQLITGIYVDDDGEPAALALCEIRPAASVGAALALIPPDTAREAARSGDMGDELFENFKEILNIAASLYNTPTTPHVKLQQALKPNEPLPPEAQKLLDQPTAQIHLDIAIPDYEHGTFAFLAY